MVSSAKVLSKPRMIWLDAVKGMLIISIMITHSCGFPFHLGPYFKAGFVSAFFVLSGFTFSMSSTKDGVAKKLKTLLFPYLFYGLICIVALFLRDWFLHGFNIQFVQNKLLGLAYSRYCLYPPYSCTEDTNVFFLREGIDPLWFMTCMFLAFIWVYIYFNSTDVIKKVLIPFYVIIPFALTYVPVLLPWSFDTSFLGALWIIIGYYMKEFFVTKRVCSYRFINVSPWWSFFGILTIHLLLTKFFGEENLSIADYGRSNGGGIICIVQAVMKACLYSFLFIRFESNLIVKALSLVGRNSLRLMCLHMAIFVIVGLVDRPKGINPLIVYIWTFFSILLTLFLAVLFEKVKKRNSNNCLKYV